MANTRRKVLVSLLPEVYNRFAERASQRDTTVGRVIKDVLMADVGVREGEGEMAVKRAGE